MSTELVIPPAQQFQSLAQAKKALQTAQSGLHKHQAGAITSAIKAGRALHYAQSTFNPSQIRAGEYKAWVEENFGATGTAEEYVRLARLAPRYTGVIEEANGQQDAVKKLVGKQIPEGLNEFCETIKQAEERRLKEESATANAVKKAAERKPKPALDAFRHPDTVAGKAGEKAEKLLRQAVDQAEAPEGVAFLCKAQSLIKEHHLTVEVGVVNE